MIVFLYSAAQSSRVMIDDCMMFEFSCHWQQLMTGSTQQKVSSNKLQLIIVENCISDSILNTLNFDYSIIMQTIKCRLPIK